MAGFLDWRFSPGKVGSVAGFAQSELKNVATVIAIDGKVLYN